MTSLETEIRRARSEAAEREAAWSAKMEADEVNSMARLEQARTWKRALVKASPGHYAMWLKGAVERGVKITHSYAYPMPDSFYMATRNIEITPLYGSNSVNIIAPAGIKIIGEPGHNAVFHMDGFTYNGWVPLYSNIA